MDMKTSPLALLKDPSLLKTDALINGQWVKGSSTFEVTDPATGLKLADVANLDAAEAERAGIIVLGRRGLGRLREILLGSVTQKVLHATDRTVVVVQ